MIANELCADESLVIMVALVKGYVRGHWCLLTRSKDMQIMQMPFDDFKAFCL